MMKTKKFKPTVEITVRNEHWDSVRKYIRSTKLRHGPFNSTWLGYVVKLEASENQQLMLQMNGNIFQMKKIVAN